MSISSDSPLPYFFVGQQISRNRSQAYKITKQPVLSNLIGKEDTLNIWYTKTHIVSLLNEIDLAGGDGVRVSFGTYEKGHEFEGQTCLLMNVTRADIISGSVVHRDVILENEPGFQLRALSSPNVKSDNEDDERRSRDFNYGSPCPPRCDIRGLE